MLPFWVQNEFNSMGMGERCVNHLGEESMILIVSSGLKKHLRETLQRASGYLLGILTMACKKS